MGKIDKDDWCKILAHQKLSENFILEFFDKVNWNLISVYQKFSENFIEEFRDKSKLIFHIKSQKVKKSLEDFI